MPGSSHTVEDGPKVDANATYARGATHPNTTTYATQAIYCDRCEMWLNGPEALKKHQRRKKHSKNIAKKVLPTFSLRSRKRKRVCMVGVQEDVTYSFDQRIHYRTS